MRVCASIAVLTLCVAGNARAQVSPLESRAKTIATPLYTPQPHTPLNNSTLGAASTSLSHRNNPTVPAFGAATPLPGDVGQNRGLGAGLGVNSFSPLPTIPAVKDLGTVKLAQNAAQKAGETGANNGHGRSAANANIVSSENKSAAAIASRERPSAFSTAPTPKSVARPSVPWNQRFTFGSQFNDVQDEWALSKEVLAAQATFSNKWGVTVVQRNQVSVTPAPRDWLAAGAFYNLTPRVRFGGELSVSSKPGAESLNLRSPAQVDTGVKVEGAIRF